MSFLAPFFLIGALAIAGPILFHLIRRTTKERTIFSSLMFLAPTPPRLTRRSRLEDILLLILRCIALALLAIGFGRPFLRDLAPTEPVTNQTRRILILLDTSASMRREGLWPAAVAKVADIAKTAKPADNLSVYTFDNGPVSVVSFDEYQAAEISGRATLVAARVNALSPTWGSTHMGNALIAAAETLEDADREKKTGGTREIFLVSDLQAGSHLDTMQAFDWPKGLQLKVEQVKPTHVTNAGLQLVTGAADGATDAAVRVRVSNAPDSKSEQFTVGWLRADGTDFAGPAVQVYAPPGQSKVVAVPIPAGAIGLSKIQLRGDEEPFDNTLNVIPPEKHKVQALYFGSEAEDDTTAPFYFLRPALPNNARLGVDLIKHAPGAPLAPTETQGASFYFVTESIATDSVAQLRQEMTAGKTVVFAPKTAAAGATLAALVGSQGVSLEDMSPSGYLMFGNIDFQHPIFSAFNDPRFSNFTMIKINKYRRIKFDAASGARTVASMDNGDPLIVEFPVGRGRLVAMATGWNRADSMLGIVATRFVPLIQSILEIGASFEKPTQFTVGDPIPAASFADAGQPVSVRTPDGDTVALPAGTANFPRTDKPGIYSILSGTKTIPVGVNLDPSESRTNPLLSDELERYGAPGATPTIDPAREARRVALQQGSETENRQKLWRWFIVATLAILLIETALAGWTARRNLATVTSGGSQP